MALLSHHLVETPIDQDYDPTNRLLFIVRGDGGFATLTVYRAESVSAWTQHTTDGNVKSVAVVGDETYLLVEREGGYFIEVLDKDLNMDSALSGQVTSASSVWSGLDHLENKDVYILADGVVMDATTVQNSAVTLSAPAYEVQIGLPYTHKITPLPPNEVNKVGGARKLRLIRALFRLKDTASLSVDIGRGLKDMPLKQLGEDDILDEPNPELSGDIEVRGLGWQKGGTAPLWKIEQSAPLPFTLLMAACEIKVNG